MLPKGSSAGLSWVATSDVPKLPPSQTFPTVGEGPAQGVHSRP